MRWQNATPPAFWPKLLPEAEQLDGMNTEAVKSVCPFCGVGCGIVLQVEDGRVTKVSGDKSHPANKGRLCTKGQTCHVPLTQGRLASAYLRPVREDEQRPVPLSMAIAQTARQLQEVIEAHGPDAVGFYISGQMSLEAQYLANKLAKGFIRTRHVEANSRLCMASAASGYKLSLGADAPPGSYDDLDHADTFLVIGANMADCHPILFLRLMDRVKQGAKLIVVDPRRSATADKADLFLQPRPGSDIALINGILRLLHEAGKTDPAFIAAHTEGWGAMLPLLEDYTLLRVAEMTGLAEADIRQAAAWIGRSRRFVSLWTMGLNQSVRGTWNTNALCNLHLATGAICRTGAGPFSLTGQPNAMGGREMGYMGPGLPGQRSAKNAEDRAFTETIWNLPLGTLRNAPATGAVDMFDEMAQGRIKACWIICTNPVASMPARSRTIAGLKAAELVIVQDAYLDTETAPYADILLPGALWAEADGVMVNSERNMTLASQAVPPPGEAMADWQLLAEVAKAMGYSGFAYDNAAEIFDEIRRFSNPRTGYDISGASHARLAQTPLQWPIGPEAASRNPVRYMESGAPLFPAASGRAQFYPRPCMPPAEMPDEAFPFTLNTGRVQHQWHTLTKTGKVPALNRLNTGPFVEIHAQDAAALGLLEGDSLELRSRRGRAVLPALVSGRVQPGCLFAPFHWNDVFGDDLAINQITNAAVDEISLQPEYKICAVALARVEAIKPAMLVPEAPAPMSALLGTKIALPELAVEERLYLHGFLQGYSLNPTGIPKLPANAPLAPERLLYLNGLLAGLLSRAPEPGAAAVTILYASQTGTAEGYAREAAQRLNAEVRALNDVTPSALSGTVFVFASTFGDGEAPDNGDRFWQALAAETAPRLEALRFGVLAFGDSAYAQFCGFGARLETRLAALGAQPLLPRWNCEPGEDDKVQTWLARAQEALGQQEAALAPTATPAISRANPFLARLAGNRRLNASGSEKETRHLVFDLAESGLSYQPGDALGVWPENDPALLEEMAKLMGLAPEALAKRDISRLTPPLLAFCAERDPALAVQLPAQDDPTRQAWLWGRQLRDVLVEFTVCATPEEWLGVLKPLTPRLYSISSSQSVHPGEVHLTVNIVRHEFAGRPSGGLCSRFLADRATGAGLFIQPSGHFHLPADDATSIIMIGPGTGIAPFRGFLQERRARNAKGRNWLVFGEQREASDFYYREELEALARDGFLHHLTTAFSRDQVQKIYVQDRLREEGAQLWTWLQDGAHLYICGDAACMAKDVHESLCGILGLHGCMDRSAANAYLDKMITDKRYLRDLY
ncbi:FAD binding domain-containing protein [Acidocella aminolytica 101 = DSM 11237]|uniref:bifunctional nitrate reductase/sulfite reductase flavoprotein subunit alpha n=2 Tax=Acidocella aminolytica TaxID=33998 RepID=UPI00091EDEA8|nr:bifunctional nitrate reductase/sulfite reductase flavoprotein subunit alpha [Acidocella aminolytica]SHE67942.1 FAD binding domain-containing protein [Acidocella aminolytica 101 = DSM 11237]